MAIRFSSAAILSEDYGTEEAPSESTNFLWPSGRSVIECATRPSLAQASAVFPCESLQYSVAVDDELSCKDHLLRGSPPRFNQSGGFCRYNPRVDGNAKRSGGWERS